MLSRQHQKIALIAALCLVGLLLLSWASTHSASYEVCKQERYSGGEVAPDLGVKVAYFFVCEGVTIDANGELITAIGTIAVAFFTLTLWLVTGKEVDLASEDFRVSKRPWIKITAPNIALRLVDGTVHAHVEICAENIGSTPAYNVRCKAFVIDEESTPNIAQTAEAFYDAQLAGAANGRFSGSGILPGQKIEIGNFTHTAMDGPRVSDLQINRTMIVLCATYTYLGRAHVGQTGHVFGLSETQREPNFRPLERVLWQAFAEPVGDTRFSRMT